MMSWWWADEELMKSWWRVDEEMMKSWWRADEELMKSWWRADEELVWFGVEFSPFSPVWTVRPISGTDGMDGRLSRFDGLLRAPTVLIIEWCKLRWTSVEIIPTKMVHMCTSFFETKFCQSFQSWVAFSGSPKILWMDLELWDGMKMNDTWGKRQLFCRDGIREQH